jgi:predicted nuclease of predicted toxin-antitoxin system
MRVLIDECLDWRLAREFHGHDATSVQKMGWSGIKNGKLLALAAADGFHVFVTADRNLAFQQNIPEIPLAIVVLEAEGIRLPQTLPLIPKVVAIISTLAPGSVTRIS